MIPGNVHKHFVKPFKLFTMKKLIFLFASITVFASSQAQTKITKEQSRVYLAQGMASFTSSVRLFYKKGQTYAEFEKGLLGKSQNTQQGRNLLKKAYEYITAGTSAVEIEKKDSGLEMAVAAGAVESIKKNNPKTRGLELFGSPTGNTSPILLTTNADCAGWWDIFCHLGNLITFIGKNKDTINYIISFFGVIAHMPTPINIIDMN
jgi:hypothetical protein